MNQKTKKTIWENADPRDLEQFGADYRSFLSYHKTERECVSGMEAMLREAGAVTLEEAAAAGKPLKSGTLVYTDMMKKSLLVARIGKQPLTDGMQLLGAHIDSPRMDLKQNPLYEDAELALFDTHYYGGIKKYQWVTLPLALHGVVAKKDGTVVDICIGEDPLDPVVGVSDLLIHLSAKQMEKKAGEVVTGEALNVLVGSRPIGSEAENEDAPGADPGVETAADKKDSEKKKNPVKANILAILKDQYDIDEDDFISAEIEVVPAGPARDYGLDRSMIMGYGQDDRVCSYPSFRAILDETSPSLTSVCLLTDKEEIGSVGATGMHSRFFENTIAALMDLQGCYSELALRKVLTSTRVLSSDVSAAFDPNYPEVMEKNNCAFLGKGPVFNKYTGSRGKSGSNDANAEYIAYLRRIMDEAGITWQTSELGKVDAGGGGTIAYILANLGMEVIDFGVAVLNMHAPWEITSKADLYEAYRAYRAFLRG